MKKKLMGILMVCVLLIGCLCSCGDTPEKVMVIEDVSTLDIMISGDGETYSASTNYIDEASFKYLYLFFKQVVLDNYKSYEEQGYNVTGDENIKVGDTEAFWNCVIGKDEDGKEVTAKQYLYDSAIDLFEEILALEAIATDYGYKLPADYNKGLEEAITNYITQNLGKYYVDADESELKDADGNIHGWLKDRWEMELAGNNFSAEEWERVFYLYPSVMIKDITTQLVDNGIVKAESDSALREQGEKERAEAIDEFLKTNIKVKVIEYILKPEEKDTKSEDASVDSVSSDEVSVASEEIISEESEESGDDTSSDASDESSDTEDLSPAEFNKQLKDKCQSIYNGLLDGSLDFDDEAKKCDLAATIEKQPDGFVLAKESFKKMFNEEADSLKVGDIRIYVTDESIDIIQVQELKKADSDLSETLSDEDMEALRAKSASAAFEKLVEEYKTHITINQTVLEKYLQSPWKFN